MYSGYYPVLRFTFNQNLVPPSFLFLNRANRPPIWTQRSVELPGLEVIPGKEVRIYQVIERRSSRSTEVR